MITKRKLYQKTMPFTIHSCRRTRQPCGFSLIELMVAVAIVGILAAIAYPSYVRHIVKSNRAAAQSFLLDISQREAQYLLDSRAYTSNYGSGGLNLTIPSKVNSLYTVTIALGTDSVPYFKATATPISGAAQDGDGALTIDSSGEKTPSDKW